MDLLQTLKPNKTSPAGIWRNKQNTGTGGGLADPQRWPWARLLPRNPCQAPEPSRVWGIGGGFWKASLWSDGESRRPLTSAVETQPPEG